MGLFVFKVMVRMIGMIRGYPYHWSLSLILFLTDGVLITFGLALAGVLRLEGGNNFFQSEYLFWKLITLALSIQIPFYYFELYDLKNFRARIRMLILLMGSFAVSFLLLAIIYYLIPILSIGRGILAITTILIFLMAFLWRATYSRVCKTLIQERILIVGTGESAKRVVNEIYANGHDSFEIIGFVDK
jgi:FlaA1/EpsC-like NDP-sugar epimerase